MRQTRKLCVSCRIDTDVGIAPLISSACLSTDDFSLVDSRSHPRRQVAVAERTGDFALTEIRRPFKNPLLAGEIIHPVTRREHLR